MLAAPIDGALAEGEGREVRVHDGDTFTLRGERIRMWGVDAPELGQPCWASDGRRVDCGYRARDELRRLIGRNAPRCRAKDFDRYGRSVEQCSVDGQDLGLTMIRRGWAITYVYKGDERPWAYVRQARYIEAEFEARRRGVGIWAWNFEKPADYRRRERQRR